VWSADVDGEHGVEVSVRQVGGRGDRVDTGVVDEDVHLAAERLDGAGSEGAEVAVGAAEVGWQEVRLPARLVDLRHDLGTPVDVAPADDDVRAVLGEGGGNRGADAAGRAGDDGSPSGQGEGGHAPCLGPRALLHQSAWNLGTA